MMSRKQVVAVRNMGVMRCCFVVAGLMMLGRLLVMPGGMAVVFSRHFVMLRTFVFSHISLSFAAAADGGSLRQCSTSNNCSLDAGSYRGMMLPLHSCDSLTTSKGESAPT